MQDDHAQQLDTFRQRSETALQEFRNEAIERQRRLIEGLGGVLDGRAGPTTAPASTGPLKTLADVLQLKINELAKTVATLERLPAVLEALKLKIDQRLDR
jgi:cobyrinic acid a,c-diamide synthase